MQATITYLLTEQAQRAQMVATGQPVARKQTVTIEVPTEDLQYYDIAADGSITVDLRGVTYLLGHRINTEAFAEAPRIPDLVRAAIVEEEAEKQKKQDALAQNLAQQMAAVEQFMNDPTKRADLTPQIGSRTVYNVYVMERANEYFAACPRYAEFVAEADRRTKADSAEAEAAKRAKEEIEAAKEAAKLNFMRTWIAEHGTASQKARSENDLLCRDESIEAIADLTFLPVAENVTPVYTRNRRPDTKCTNEECDAEDCQVEYSVEDFADCLTEHEYEGYAAIKKAMPDADYVLRTRLAVHDCGHSPGCATGKIHTCLVKQQVGPFNLQREYLL